jgi:hypothetical protein
MTIFPEIFLSLHEISFICKQESRKVRVRLNLLKTDL